jgi:hypothetical protein
MSNISNEDARTTADKIVRRERRRIRTLAGLAIGLWIIATLLIASVYLPVGAKLKQFAIMLSHDAPAGFRYDPFPPGNATAPAPVPTAEQLPGVVAEIHRQQWVMGEIILHEWIVGAIILVLAMATGGVASVATVVLALTIRRVTMRQVSEQLATISDQLRQLQRGGTTS